MTGLTTSDDPPFLPVALTSKNRFIKVKRKADEHPLPLLVLEEGDHTCLYLLSSSTSEDTNFSSRQPIAIDTFLSELKSDKSANAKRPRVEAIPVRFNMRAVLTKELSDGEAEDSMYDYYIQRDPAQLRQVLIEDYNKIGIITSFQEVEFASDEELDLETFDDEDSNAEDYYANDYPDEDSYYGSENEQDENEMYSTDGDEFGNYDEFEDDYSHCLWRDRFPRTRHRENTSDSDCWLYRSILHPFDDDARDTGEPLQ